MISKAKISCISSWIVDHQGGYGWVLDGTGSNTIMLLLRLSIKFGLKSKSGESCIFSLYGDL